MKTHASTKQNITPARNAGVARSAFFCPSAEPATAFFSTTRGPLQTALTVSQPGELHEIEAEKMADQVVAHQDPPFFSGAAGVQRQAAESMEELDRAVEGEAEGLEETEEKLSPVHRSSLSRSPGVPPQHFSARRNPGSAHRPPRPRAISPTLSRSALPVRSVGLAARVNPSRARGPPTVSREFESRLRSSKGGGQPLSPGTRVEMESSFGADFSGVRVHAGGEADQLNRGINARAFTHGQDIYFAQNRYQPQDRAGRHLLAHELTHVIQQGGGIRETQPAQRYPDLSRAPPTLQRIPTSMEELRGEINGLAENIPGYALGTVLIGYNPILGQNVSWSASAFFRGAAGLIPGGVAVYDSLNEGGAIDEAFAWIEGQIASRNLTWGRVSSLWDVAWEKMGVTEGISGNVDIFSNTFSGFFADVLGFIGAVVDKLTSILKDLAIAAVRALFGSDGPAYDMITMVLGEDPLTGEARTWETVEFLRSALQFFGFGNHIAKMDETGQLQNAADWLDQQFGILSSALSGLISGITDIWDSLGLETLANPLDVLTRTVGVVTGFVGSLLEFVGNLASKILELIKEIVISLAKAYAYKIPGYRLFTVIIGLDPISGEGVPRTAMNFVHGFLDFVPNGEEIYKNLEEGNAIGKAMDWLGEQAAQLGLTPGAIVQRFTDLWTSFSIDDLMDPIGAFERVAGVFLGFIGDVLTLAGRIALKLLEILFEVVMGGGGARVLAILKQAQGTFDTIVKDPVTFVGNLVAAAKLGFTQFAGNILEHLKTGLLGWLFGALEGAGIQLPATFDLQGMLSLALQVLGLTYAQIRPQLVQHLGEPLVGHLETAFEVVKILLTEGLAGIWSRITEFLTVSLPEMVIGAIKNFVMEKIVTAAVTKIASMLNPAGAVVQAIIATYNTVMFFIERMNQIMATVEAFVGSVSKIAAGDIGDAANAVEQTMAKTLPVIISFLARLLGLGGISDKIREIIQKIQAPIQAAIGKVIGWIVAQAKKLGRAVMGKGKDGKKEDAEGEPQEETGDVKELAKQRLMEKLGETATAEDANAAIPSVLQEFAPQGLSSLMMVPETGEDGGYQIKASASPIKVIMSLARKIAKKRVSVALHADLRFAQPVQLVETRPLPGARNPSAERGQSTVIPGTLSDVPGQDNRSAGLYPGADTPGSHLRNPSRAAGAVLHDPVPSTRAEVLAWNAGSDFDVNTCNNQAHAETTLAAYIGGLATDKKRLLESMRVTINLSPCSMCAATIAGIGHTAGLGAATPGGKAVLSISWVQAYVNEGKCSNLTTNAGSVAQMQAAGWSTSGPLPPGVSSEQVEEQKELLVTAGAQRKAWQHQGLQDPLETEADTAADAVGGERMVQPLSKRSGLGSPDWGAERFGVGHPLPGVERRDLESRFGHDFSRVRIHTGASAARLSKRILARAFTTKSQIYFNNGEYAPHTPKGRSLLAHELSHVIQQGAAPPLAGSRSHTQPNTTMKIRPTFRRSARRVSRRASEAPFFQNEAPEAPFFSPASDARAKAPEEEPANLAKKPEEEPVIAKKPEEEIQAKTPEEEEVQAKKPEDEEIQAKQEDEEVRAKQDDEEPVMAKCGCGCGGGGPCQAADVPKDARAKRAPEGAAVTASPAKDETCSGGELAVISLARSRAKLLADRAVAGLTSLLLLEDAPGNPPAALANFERWFGGYDAGRVRFVRNQFLKLASALAGAVEFDCDCDRAIYAFATPGGKRRITLCKLFWSAGFSGYDSKAGVILHELAHDVCFALDLRYGTAKAEALAKTSPLLATLNADNYEYFAESL